MVLGDHTSNVSIGLAEGRMYQEKRWIPRNAKEKSSSKVISDPKPQERWQKSEPVVTKAELAKQAAIATPAVPPPPQVDCATDLFNLLSMEDSGN